MTHFARRDYRDIPPCKSSDFRSGGVPPAAAGRDSGMDKDPGVCQTEKVFENANLSDSIDRCIEAVRP